MESPIQAASQGGGPDGCAHYLEELSVDEPRLRGRGHHKGLARDDIVSVRDQLICDHARGKFRMFHPSYLGVDGPRRATLLLVMANSMLAQHGGRLGVIPTLSGQSPTCGGGN